MASTSDSPSVGIIGMGEMGRMYAKYLSNGGQRRWEDSKEILLT